MTPLLLIKTKFSLIVFLKEIKIIKYNPPTRPIFFGDPG
jgi:hypothetical protein